MTKLDKVDNLAELQKKLKTTEVGMVSILTMQESLAKGISDLTTVSALHQVARKIIDAFFFCDAFFTCITKATITITEEVVTKSGFRLTAFSTIISKRLFIKHASREAIKELSKNGCAKIRDAVAKQALNNLANSSQIALCLDAFNSGKGTLEQLYKINDELNRKYDELAKQHKVLLNTIKGNAK